MKINFYNYDLIGKRLSYQYPLVMKFIEEQDTDDFEQLNNLIAQKFNHYGPENGYITIDTKTIALLKLNKEEIKLTIQDNLNTIYNKDFKKIILKINAHLKNNPNKDLSLLKSFFQFSLRAKSEYISLYLKCKEL